ncbi:actin maturation protease-like [Phlebotomus argentipes]|uniref:actin maturation protease-like n=1 Tax=Phlebotomus argentipes TaxID=94469 RepID=UPI002892D645|nr:actin maturation protease-like [Phlebotomus argentipes]
MSHEIIPIPPPAPDFAAVTAFRSCASPKYTVALPECLWASADPEVQKSCFLARVCQHRAPRECVFHRVAPILQEGPTCGFVTISMLLGGVRTADQLFQEAKAKGFTALGEMFSAANLMDILQSQVQFSGSCHLFVGDLNCDEIREALKRGVCLIVPYDSDVNHSPCLRRGHKAHWALITGYLIDDDGQFYVIARQGKSRLLGIWPLSVLAESNANLTEFAQPKQHPEANFILPEGGIAGPKGLCRRSIVISDGFAGDKFIFH